MDTERLRKLRRPSQIEGLLESLAADIAYVPANARPIVSAAELPCRLQPLATQGFNQAWRAWTDEVRIWFIAGRVSDAVSRRLGQLALRVFFYDMDGKLASSGVWTLTPAGHWELCEASDTVSLSEELLARRLRHSDSA